MDTSIRDGYSSRKRDGYSSLLERFQENQSSSDEMLRLSEQLTNLTTRRLKFWSKKRLKEFVILSWSCFANAFLVHIFLFEMDQSCRFEVQILNSLKVDQMCNSTCDQTFRTSNTFLDQHLRVPSSADFGSWIYGS